MIDLIYYNQIKLLPIKALVFFDDRNDDERIVIYDILSESSWDLNPVTRVHSQYNTKTVGYLFQASIVVSHNLFRSNQVLENFERIHLESNE
jgi:hypothetical protein